MICQYPLLSDPEKFILKVDNVVIDLSQTAIIERHWYLQSGESVPNRETIEVHFNQITVVKSLFTAWHIGSMEVSLSEIGYFEKFTNADGSTWSYTGGQNDMPRDILLPWPVAVKRIKLQLVKSTHQVNAFFQMRGCEIEGENHNIRSTSIATWACMYLRTVITLFGQKSKIMKAQKSLK